MHSVSSVRTFLSFHYGRTDGRGQPVSGLGLASSLPPMPSAISCLLLQPPTSIGVRERKKEGKDFPPSLPSASSLQERKKGKDMTLSRLNLNGAASPCSRYSVRTAREKRGRRRRRRRDMRIFLSFLPLVRAVKEKRAKGQKH